MCLCALTKIICQGKRFSNEVSLVLEVKVWLHAQPAEFYGGGLHSYIKRWEKYITLAEAYVKKDKNSLTVVSPIK